MSETHDNIVATLVENGLCTSGEIASATGRSSTNIQQWVAGETEPAISDVIHMLAYLSESAVVAISDSILDQPIQGDANPMAEDEVKEKRVVAMKMMFESSRKLARVIEAESLNQAHDVLPTSAQLEAHIQLMGVVERNAGRLIVLGAALRMLLAEGE